MIKFILRFLSIAVCACLVQGSVDRACAQTPGIKIDLNFDKTTFAPGEPVGVGVVVTNTNQSTSDGDLLVSEGFSTQNFFLEIRVIDPAGRLLLPVKDELDDFHDEFPDAPPLPYVLYNGEPVMVSGCEVFTSGEVINSNIEDLREYFDMSLPGYYSAKVQVSTTVFKENTGMDSYMSCSLDNYTWRGLLESKTVYFYLQADSSDAQVIPDQWRLSWLEEGKKIPDIQVQLRSKDGKGVENIDPNSIKLNGKDTVSVSVLPPQIKAFFNPKIALESLGSNLQAGEWYSVLISGRLKSGEPFGTQKKIRLVK